MTSLILSQVALPAGFVLYGRFTEKIFGPDGRQTPAVSISDGVDCVPMKPWKAFWAQLLNIAGTGPIFGALMGARFGPVVFLRIVFGSILGGHYTFTIDGEDIWKHIKRNGVTVESSLTGAVRTEYKILRDGRQIAVATGSSQNVHEEDEAAKSKLASLVPMQGFYRVSTTETDLSLLLVTLLAFARSGATDDRGGNFKTIVGTAKKIGQG